MAHWSDYTSENRFRQERLDSSLRTAAGASEYGDGSGPHFTLGNVAAGIGLAFAVWLTAPLIGIHQLWALPALIVGIIAAQKISARRATESEPAMQTAKRRGHAVLFNSIFWGAVGIVLGAWFAISTGEMSPGAAAALFGGLGAVLGIVLGVLFNVLRALLRRK